MLQITHPLQITQTRAKMKERAEEEGRGRKRRSCFTGYFLVSSLSPHLPGASSHASFDFTNALCCHQPNPSLPLPSPSLLSLVGMKRFTRRWTECGICQTSRVSLGSCLSQTFESSGLHRATNCTFGQKRVPLFFLVYFLK